MKVSVAGSLAFLWLWVAQAQAQDWIALGPVGQRVFAVAIDPSDSATIYVGTDFGMFKTTDGGVSWQSRSAGLGPFVGKIKIDPRSPSTVYAVASDTEFPNVSSAFKTVDGGMTWSRLPIGPGVYLLELDLSAPSTLLAVTAQGAFRSRDAGLSWAFLGDGLRGLDVRQVLQAPSSPSTLYAAAFGAPTLFRSSDSGATWIAAGGTFPHGEVISGLLAVDPRSASTIYVLGLGCGERGPCISSLFRSTDGGETLSYLGIQGFGISGLAIDPIVPSTLYLAEGPYILRSSDGGANWSGPIRVAPGTSVNTDIYTVTLHPSYPLAVYVGTSSGVFRSTFAGGCSPSATVLCLDSGRFQVEVSFDRGVPTGHCLECPGQAWPVTSNTGAFWFFDPANLELVAKILDGRSINGKWWVFYGSLTNVEFTLTVTDTQTGAIRTYINPQGQLASVADTSAF